MTVQSAPVLDPAWPHVRERELEADVLEGRATRVTILGLQLIRDIIRELPKVEAR